MFAALTRVPIKHIVPPVSAATALDDKLSPSHALTGFGQFGAVGFSYGGEAAHDPVAAAGGAAPPWAPQPTSDASESDSESDSSETDEVNCRACLHKWPGHG